MRRVILAISAFFMFTGCATVSMVPSQTVTLGLVAEESSALQTQSQEFVTLATERKWASDASGFNVMAAILLRGMTHAPRIETAYLNIASDLRLNERIAGDAILATSSLASVTHTAQALLASGHAVERDDVMAFEQALMSAQTTYRTFVTCLESKSIPSNEVTVKLPLLQFEETIDDARQVANVLGDKYADATSGGMIANF